MNDTTTPTPGIPDIWACPHNDGVSCSPYQRNCFACGWYPDVAKDRLEQICMKLGIPAPKATVSER